MLIYGESDKRKRKYFIRQLIQNIKEIRGPLVCLGDWNNIWNKVDKIGWQLISPWNLREANNILYEGRLVDLGFEGRPFAWIKKLGENNYVKERLDREATNIQWRLIFPKAIVENNSLYGSNHGPIFLKLELKMTFVPRPFRFKWMWTQDPGV